MVLAFCSSVETKQGVQIETGDIPENKKNIYRNFHYQINNQHNFFFHMSVLTANVRISFS